MKKVLTIAAAALCAACTAQAQVAPPLTSPAAPVASKVASVEIAGPVLRVTDMERSLKFYTEGLGLVITRRIPNGNVILNAEGKSPTPFIMLLPHPSAAGTPPLQVGNGLSRIFLRTADVAAMHARLTAAGYKPGAISAGSGVFFVDDPDGYHYEITGTSQRRP
jgi:lactoylglutathione lyase